MNNQSRLGGLDTDFALEMNRNQISKEQASPQVAVYPYFTAVGTERWLTKFSMFGLFKLDP